MTSTGQFCILFDMGAHCHQAVSALGPAFGYERLDNYNTWANQLTTPAVLLGQIKDLTEKELHDFAVTRIGATKAFLVVNASYDYWVEVDLGPLVPIEDSGLISKERGGIRDWVLYKQGKALDHRGWSVILPRNIAPSDIDFVFDDDVNGRTLLVELSRNVTKVECSGWDGLKPAQALLYKNLVRHGRGKIIAVLALHNVPEDRQIDTRLDIVAFCTMHYSPAFNSPVGDPVVQGNEKWQQFVKDFFAGKD